MSSLYNYLPSAVADALQIEVFGFTYGTWIIAIVAVLMFYMAAKVAKKGIKICLVIAAIILVASHLSGGI